MLKISVFELFVGVIPEAFIFVFGAYVLSQIPFDYGRIVVTGLITGVATYFIRLLPIFPGINIIFVSVVFISSLVLINKIYIMKAVSSFVFLLMIRLITEWLNLIVLSEVLYLDLNELAKNPVSKTLSFLPSVLVFFLVVAAIYFIKQKKKNKENTNGSH